MMWFFYVTNLMMLMIISTYMQITHMVPGKRNVFHYRLPYWQFDSFKRCPLLLHPNVISHLCTMDYYLWPYTNKLQKRPRWNKPKKMDTKYSAEITTLAILCNEKFGRNSISCLATVSFSADMDMNFIEWCQTCLSMAGKRPISNPTNPTVHLSRTTQSTTL